MKDKVALAREIYTVIAGIEADILGLQQRVVALKGTCSALGKALAAEQPPKEKAK
jgi:hypothetical protein